MATSKKKNVALSNFFTTSPLKVAGVILLIMSVLLNLGVLLFIVLLNHTSAFDLSLESYTLSKTCRKDYAEVLEQVSKGSHDPQAAKKFFAAGVCFRDYETSKPIDIRSVKPLQ